MCGLANVEGLTLEYLFHRFNQELLCEFINYYNPITVRKESEREAWTTI